MGYNVKKKIDENAKIAVLCGGPSSEREISLRSAKNVLAALKRQGYENAELVDIDKNIAKTLLDKKIDIAYNAMHGRFGEDGCIQGLLEIMEIPYTGCGVMSSSLCMNKEHTKNILKSAQIPLIKSVLLQKNDDYAAKIKDLKMPLMLKPVSEGSSIGMFKVNNLEEFKEEVQKQRHFARFPLFHTIPKQSEAATIAAGPTRTGRYGEATESAKTTAKSAKVGASMTEFFHRRRTALTMSTQTQTRIPAKASLTIG